MQVKDLERSNKQQQLVIHQLTKDVKSLELYSRRENLLIDGITESPQENVEIKVKQFLKSVLKMDDVDKIQFSRIHRLGRQPYKFLKARADPRPVIVRFHFYPDRDRVWKASWNMDKKIYRVREDFPESVLQNRRALLPCLMAAKKDQYIKKAQLRGECLILDGKEYTVDNIKEIPFRLRWTVKGEHFISQCNSTFFFGKDCYLSNFHSCLFKDDQNEYSCSEQYFLEKKALMFDDETTASAIKRETRPERMKAMSYNIKGRDENIWNKHARGIMEKAVTLKFRQNPHLQQKLLASRGRLVEANKHDKQFSCGLSLSDPNIMDESKWQGENWLGDILTELRNKLQSE